MTKKKPPKPEPKQEEKKQITQKERDLAYIEEMKFRESFDNVTAAIFASPFSDPEKRRWKRALNVGRARACVRALTLLLNGRILIYAPHLYMPTFLDDDDANERAVGMSQTRHLMYMLKAANCSPYPSNAHPLLVVDKTFGVSPGMQEEIRHANQIGMPIMPVFFRYYTVGDVYPYAVSNELTGAECRIPAKIFAWMSENVPVA